MFDVRATVSARQFHNWFVFNQTKATIYIFCMFYLMLINLLL